jgi:hypothetical protein
MPGTTRELSNSSDMPRQNSLQGGAVIPALSDSGQPVAFPVALWMAVHQTLTGGQSSLESRIEAMESGAAAGVDYYADIASGLAGTSDGEFFSVVSTDEKRSFSLYLNDSGVAVLRASVPSSTFFESFLGPDKNIFDKTTMVRPGKYYSPGSDAIISSSPYRCTTFIPVIEGEKYGIQGVENNMTAIFADAADDTANFSGQTTLSSGQGIVTVPEGYPYLVINITNDGSNVTTFDDTLQVEKNNGVTDYEPYRLVFSVDKMPGGSEFVRRSDILKNITKNLVDLDSVDYTNRYSTGSLSFAVDALGLAASDWIPVEEGEFYVLWGDGVYTGWQGGYFTAYGATEAHSNISFGSPPSGLGKIFQVPTGQGITHVVVSLKKLNNSASATQLHGPVQLEKGEVSTDFEAFSPIEYVDPSLIFGGSSSSGSPSSATVDASSWFKFVEADEGSPLIDKIPSFQEKWLKRESDVCVVNTGTSLTARTTEHCSDHPDASYRPPLMHSMNFATHIWDRLKWDGQEYRRYDADTIFSESGSFTVSKNLSEWDDGLYRNGLTRYSESTSAAVSFSVPVDAWQFNFIYRTDSVGCDAQVSVAEGNGQMEVWNGSAWVEANGFSFSMAEAAPVARDIDVPSPSTMLFTSYNIPSKGNTTYQKRLKMRCRNGTGLDSRSTAKAVTISRTGGGARFCYWGVEWSPREFMVTYINAARGSHNTQATGATGLPRYQDNEIWSFEPDLLLFELPIHNDGAAAAGVYAEDYWKNLTENFVFRDDYELSLKTRGASFGLNPEIAMFTASIAWNFGGIEDDGSLKYSTQSGGKVMSALDKYQEAYFYVKDTYPEAVCINAAKRWVDAGFAIHGDLKTATLGSGKSGSTFTNEGSHWNDTGSKIMAKAVLPLLNFVL